MGWHPIEITKLGQQDSVFKSFKNKLNVLHWHGDTFNLPPGAVHLASTPSCQNQAFPYSQHVYGLQYHLEATETMVRDWCHDPLGPDYIRSAGEGPETIMKMAGSMVSDLKPYAKNLFETYFKISYLNSTSQLLSSK